MEPTPEEVTSLGLNASLLAITNWAAFSGVERDSWAATLGLDGAQLANVHPRTLCMMDDMEYSKFQIRFGTRNTIPKIGAV